MVRPYLFYFFRVDRSWFSKMTMLVRKFLHGGKIKYTVGWLFISKNVAALLMIFLLIFFASPKKNQKKSPANNNTQFAGAAMWIICTTVTCTPVILLFNSKHLAIFKKPLLN